MALASYSDARQNSYDALASGPFELFGRKHELLVGAMASRRVANDYSIGFVFPRSSMGNYYDWTGDYPEPDFSSAKYALIHTEIKQSAIYGAARFSLAASLKLILGGRISDYDITSQYKRHGEFTPYAGLVYDLNDRYSAYASYAEIFAPQNYRDRDNQLLKPATGKNAELGLKGEYLNGRVNASAALFETRLDNVAQTDTGYLLPNGTQAYYGANGTRSRGVDVDLQGELAGGWHLSAGASHFSASSAAGARLNSQLPRSTVRLFTTYRVPALNRLTVGGGVTWQSRYYQAATSPGGASNVEQQPYRLATLMARYAVSRDVDLALNVNNLFDKKYTVMSGFYNQVLYGAPRSFMLTLNYKL